MVERPPDTSQQLPNSDVFEGKSVAELKAEIDDPLTSRSRLVFLVTHPECLVSDFARKKLRDSYGHIV